MKRLIPQLAIAFCVVSLLALLLLHFLSADIHPVWHMVSEYAFGQYNWLLSVFFFAWALAYVATGIALWGWAKSIPSKIAVILIFVSAIGACMGGLFDVRHPLHGAAFGLGIPFLPIAALIISRHLRKRHHIDSATLRILAHATWISVVLMGVAMALYISGMQNAGGFPATPELLTSLPDSVIAFHGIPNRILVVVYIAWLIMVNKKLSSDSGVHP